MFLCNAYIVVALREAGAENIQAGACGHGGGNGGDVRFICRESGEVSAECFRVGDDTAFAGAAVLHVILADAVELGGVAGRRGIAAAFFGNHVDDDRPFVTRGNAQCLFQACCIMPVHWAVVAQPKLLEEAQRCDDAVCGAH